MIKLLSAGHDYMLRTQKSIIILVVKKISAR